MLPTQATYRDRGLADRVESNVPTNRKQLVRAGATSGPIAAVDTKHSVRGNTGATRAARALEVGGVGGVGPDVPKIERRVHL